MSIVFIKMKTFDARAKMSIEQSNVNLAENHELNQLAIHKVVNEIILNTILPLKYYHTVSFLSRSIDF